MDPAADKAAMRSTMRERVRGLEAEHAASASARICQILGERLGDVLKGAGGVVLSFASIQRAGASNGSMHDEVDLSAFHDALIRRGALALPRIDWEQRTMTAMRLEVAEGLDRQRDLEARRFGVPEPRAGLAMEPGELRAVLVPGLGFDRTGARLGRGAGFYDRYLRGIGPETLVIGVCFEVQVVERVPTEAHDRSVDTLVTERGWTECGTPRRE
jgi:5-formyltetrahydrofolate cyclo-ligase